jgi:hypothetical protein
MSPHVEARRTRSRSGGQLIVKAGVHYVFPALEEPWEGALWLSDGAHACIGTKIGPFGRHRHGNFGVDFGAAFLIVALGKRPPMPYVWLPRRGAGLVPERQGTFGALRCSARMVEVPNPAKFLG